ncbi:hypothetical protein GOP47_0028195 [Adiantum capillus-veneris]|nr:hypothetical protein GOP47_0028195 [Adiantum capillus-veneris]
MSVLGSNAAHSRRIPPRTRFMGPPQKNHGNGPSTRLEVLLQSAHTGSSCAGGTKRLLCHGILCFLSLGCGRQ